METPNSFIIRVDHHSDDSYVAWIQEGEYKGCVVSGDSLHECLDELATSIRILLEYRGAIPVNL